MPRISQVIVGVLIIAGPAWAYFPRLPLHTLLPSIGESRRYEATDDGKASVKSRYKAALEYLRAKGIPSSLSDKVATDLSKGPRNSLEHFMFTFEYMTENLESISQFKIVKAADSLVLNKKFDTAVLKDALEFGQIDFFYQLNDEQVLEFCQWIVPHGRAGFKYLADAYVKNLAELKNGQEALDLARAQTEEHLNPKKKSEK